jgi:hypothetical protein
VYQGCLKNKTVIAELDSAIHWQEGPDKTLCSKINDIDAASLLQLYRCIFTMDCRIKFGNDGFDGFRQHLSINTVSSANLAVAVLYAALQTRRLARGCLIPACARCFAHAL